MIKTLKKWTSRMVKQVKSLVKKVVGYFAKAFVKEEPASTKSSETACKTEAQSTAVKESNKEAAEEVVAEEVTVEQQETVVTASVVSVVATVTEVQVTKLTSAELVINDTYLLAGLLSRPPPISHP